MKSKSVDTFIAAFSNVKRKGKEYVCACPNCEAGDSNGHHLFITQGYKDGIEKILLDCKHGCGVEEIVHAAGKEMDALIIDNGTELPAKDKKKNELRDAVSTKAYVYNDATGVPFARKIRYTFADGSKDFRWAHTDADGKTHYGLPKGEHAPLYHLDKLMQGNAMNMRIVVEGEKDVDTLCLIPGVETAATTAPNGGGSKNEWYADYDEALAGYDVIVITDNDDAGEKYGKYIARNAAGKAATIRIIPASALHDKAGRTAPPKADFTDLAVEIGLSRAFEVLSTLISETEPLTSEALDALKASTDKETTTEDAEPAKEVAAFDTISAAELMTKEFAPLWQPVAGIISEGLTIFAGASKAGKSWAALDMALAIAEGREFWGMQTESCNVLYLALEDSQRRIQSRIAKYGYTAETTPKLLTFAYKAERIGDGFEKQLSSWLEAQEGRSVVIVDVMQKIKGSRRRNEDAYEGDYRIVSALKGIADAHGAAVVALHHLSKGSASADKFERINGSTGIMGVADSALLLDRVRGEDTAILSRQGRDIYGDDIELSFKDCRWSVITFAEKATQLKQKYDAEPATLMLKRLTKDAENGKRLRISYAEFITQCFDLFSWQYGAKELAKKLQDNEYASLLSAYDGIHALPGICMAGNVKGIEYWITRRNDDQ